MTSLSWSWFWSLAAGVSLLKCLFINAYRSTDFEVHRNWLAITHSQRLSRWYYENTSEWTLDYPPLFAWFEFSLSYVASHFDRSMLLVENVNYVSPAAVLFQRLSVVFSDGVFICAVRECCRCVWEQKGSRDVLNRPPFVLAVLLLWNFGLLIVDHVHFQYNGFLFGFLLLSLSTHLQSRHLLGALLFAILLNLKHIYLYVAPAYGIYLLRSYCFTRDNKDGSVQWTSFSLRRLLALAGIVGSVFTLSFGPFITMGQLPQVLSRLFPFKRGLCHAYWAPNIWALYNILDKSLVLLGVRLKLLQEAELPRASMTGGLVQEFQHSVLPSVSPSVTLVCTLLSILPALVSLWRRPRGARGFLRCLLLCALGSFIFGWHVHEKAILIVILPLRSASLTALTQASPCFSVCLFLSPIGFHCQIPHVNLPDYKLSFSSSSGPDCLLHPLEVIYLLGLVVLAVLCDLIYPLSPWQQKFPFLPLLVTSVYCSVGVCSSFVRLYISLLRQDRKLKQL
ncbi:probable dolichyl pyrophosphate Glc1Man9GlcNAc2 alpha-1,3-glucosyltransferase [Thalassophryne amazonica]|uniref:probable dolichyl pyrophosphate Glc1Man9GlcNAc2 alpha-1,3-glucosyltransferase n=1 Tax=Thalassophryne amazonica TaxID=390379 RepID=UPI001471B87D|nr:probable dolichyl pyrophosphate Glc1Man9GlcNAc2 alpha-1,3-glucosyltransferase [Thalassophryne amazonica]